MDYKKAIQQIVQNRKDKLNQAQLLYLELLRTNAKLYETEKAIRNIKMDIRRGKSNSENELASLEVQKRNILKQSGVTDEMLNPPYSCVKCKDTGLVNDKPCSCVISKCVSDGMVGANTFSDSNELVFPVSERERITSVYSSAKTFCDKFPNTQRLNLLLMGRCGSGKSFLASCIANEISTKGFSVIMLSAFSFVHRMLKYHTTFDSDKFTYIDPLLDCDLLIIDDLGSENVLKNVTVEYLFHVINERMNANKHTVFTTNLDDEMICARYGERTYSRLFGSRQSIGFALSNTDLRKQ